MTSACYGGLTVDSCEISAVDGKEIARVWMT